MFILGSIYYIIIGLIDIMCLLNVFLEWNKIENYILKRIEEVFVFFINKVLFFVDFFVWLINCIISNKYIGVSKVIFFYKMLK